MRVLGEVHGLENVRLVAWFLSQPAFALGLADAGDEVVADLLQPAALSLVRSEE
ncbi:hypothetical protein ACIRQQ_39165 [Streptomyces fuscichromogenes]|uniref:hypothetical protein n=1 Tax=Streptomyces fuscichromogenes TaxID=1324013 RepID=UPI00380ACA41